MKNEKCEVIAYWKMGRELCNEILDDYQNTQRIMMAVSHIEDSPKYPNVGRFSHPNEDGEIQLDAAYMEGNGRVGAVIETSHIVNPCQVAESLSHLNQNMILASLGADQYAEKNGFECREQLEICADDLPIKGHDTFGVIQLKEGHFILSITTSGRKGKMPFRVGDSPLIGSGFYCEDGIGACIATGDGEACLRSVMAKEVVDRLMLGESVEGVCQRVLERGLNKLDYQTELSLLAVDKDGCFDAASTFEVFPYSFINEGKIYNRYLYKGIEYKQEDEQFNELYKGD